MEFQGFLEDNADYNSSVVVLWVQMQVPYIYTHTQYSVTSPFNVWNLREKRLMGKGEGITTVRETDERKKIMRRAGIDGRDKARKEWIWLEGAKPGQEEKKKSKTVRERTEKQRESKSISYVIMSHCASHLTFAWSPTHLLTYILPALAVSTHCLFMSHQHTHPQFSSTVITIKYTNILI